MAPIPLEIKLEIELDNTKYFPGDQITGKIILTPNQAYSNLRSLRLAWTGRIEVEPIPSIKDSREYFNECWRFGPSITKSKKITTKSHGQISSYTAELVPDVEFSELLPKIEISKNKSVAFTFALTVPSDIPLPSTTGASDKDVNRIFYLLEAFILDEGGTKDNKSQFCQKAVYVAEPIYTQTPEMLTPMREEATYRVFVESSPLSFEGRRLEFESAMRATIPCMGSKSGIAIPISISVWNSMEFERKDGISVALLRVNQVLANGRAYSSQGKIVYRALANLNLTAENNNNEMSIATQNVKVVLPIPRKMTPSITLDKSQLMIVSYFIRVRVLAQKGQYVTKEGDVSDYMTVDLPFTIGTLLKPSDAGSPISGMPTSPTSTHSSTTLSPEFTESTLAFSHNDKKMTLGGVFRKASTGNSSVLSNTSSMSNGSTDESKKKNRLVSTGSSGLFSTIRLLGRKPKSSRDDLIVQGNSNEVDLSDAKSIKPSIKEELETDNATIISSETQFHSSESVQDEESTSNNDSDRALAPKERQQTFNQFDIFNDNDDDDDDYGYEYEEMGSNGTEKNLSSSMAEISLNELSHFNSSANNDTIPPPKQQQSDQYNLLEDKGRPNEEGQQASIISENEHRVDIRDKSNKDITSEAPLKDITINSKKIDIGEKSTSGEIEYDKPNQYSEEYKPNAVTDDEYSSSEDEDEDDLLSILAKKQKNTRS